MSSFSQNVWRPPQDAATPGMGMLFACRMTGLAVNSQAVQVYLVPDISTNTAQIKGSTNVAWNSNPVQRHAKPQQGLRFYTAGITLADPNGSLRNTGNLSLQINNLSQGNTVLSVPLIVSGGAAPGADGQSAYYPVGGGLYGISYVNVVRPYDDLQIALQTPSNTSSTATAVTVVVHGMWL